MHTEHGTIPTDYLDYTKRKVYWIAGGIILVFVLFILAISVGAVAIPPVDVIQ